MHRGKILLLLIALALMGLVACGDMSPQITQSPQFRDGEFQNPIAPSRAKSLWSFITYRTKVEQGDWPEWVENTATPQLQESADEIVLTFINHATFLAEIGDIKILFDPVFSNTAGPTSWLGAERHRAPALTIDELPKIDAIFISHNHYEHMDLPALRKLSRLHQPQIFVPLGDKAWLDRALRRYGAPLITQMDWWQEARFGDSPNDSNGNSFTVHFVPAQHWSRRGLFDTNKSLWGGFITQHADITLFHAGDTGYSPHFKEIGKRFDIDVAMLPIGDYEPEWFMGYGHMNPAQAVEAHKDLDVPLSFGMHSETFRLTATDFGEAEADLAKALADNPDIKGDFKKLKVGESFRVKASQ